MAAGRMRGALALCVLAASVWGMPFMDDSEASGVRELGEAQQQTADPATPAFSVSLPELTKEINDRKAAGTTHDNEIKAEASQRQTDIDASNAALSAVRNQVSSNTLNLQTDMGKVNGDISSLQTTAQAEKTTVDSKFATMTTAVGNVDSAVQAEVTNREADTKTLTTAATQLRTDLMAKVDGVDADIKSEVQTAVSKQTGVTTTVQQQVTANAGAISTETDARKKDDSVFKAEIAGLQAKVGELVGALQDVQQGKQLDIPALQAAVSKASADSSYSSATAVNTTREIS